MSRSLSAFMLPVLIAGNLIAGCSRPSAEPTTPPPAADLSASAVPDSAPPGASAAGGAGQPGGPPAPDQGQPGAQAAPDQGQAGASAVPGREPPAAPAARVDEPPGVIACGRAIRAVRAATLMHPGVITDITAATGTADAPVADAAHELSAAYTRAVTARGTDAEPDAVAAVSAAAAELVSICADSGLTTAG